MLGQGYSLTSLFKQFLSLATLLLFLFSLNISGPLPYANNFFVPKYTHHSHCWFLLITSQWKKRFRKKEVLCQLYHAARSVLSYSNQTACPSSSHSYIMEHRACESISSSQFPTQARHSSKWSRKMSLQMRYPGKIAAEAAFKADCGGV